MAERPYPDKSAYDREKFERNREFGMPKKERYSGKMPRPHDIDPNAKLRKPNISGKADFTSDYKKPGVDDKPLSVYTWLAPYVGIALISSGAGLARAYAAKHGDSWLGEINTLEQLLLVSAGVPGLGALIGAIHEAGISETSHYTEWEGREVLGGFAGGVIAVVCEQSSFYAGNIIF